MRNVPSKPPTKLVATAPKSGALGNKAVDPKAATLGKSPSKAVAGGNKADPTAGANLTTPQQVQKTVSRDNSKTTLDAKKES